MTRQEFIDALLDLVNDYLESEDKLDTKLFDDFIGMSPEEELSKLTIRRTQNEQK